MDARHAAQAVHALPALTRAQNIHALLVAIPGRQGAAHRCFRCDASIAPVEAAPANRRWSFRGGELRKAAHGCAAAASQPWMADRAGEQSPARNDPTEGRIQSLAMGGPLEWEKILFFGSLPAHTFAASLARVSTG